MLKLHRKKRYPKDINGWVEAIHKPFRFELVQIEDEFGARQNAWWDGLEWDYGKKRIRGEILKWRKPYGYIDDSYAITIKKEHFYGRIS